MVEGHLSGGATEGNYRGLAVRELAGTPQWSAVGALRAVVD